MGSIRYDRNMIEDNITWMSAPRILPTIGAISDPALPSVMRTLSVGAQSKPASCTINDYGLRVKERNV